MNAGDYMAISAFAVILALAAMLSLAYGDSE